VSCTLDLECGLPIVRLEGCATVETPTPAPELHHWWEAWDDVSLLTIDGDGVLGVANQGNDCTPMAPYPSTPNRRLAYSATGGPNDRPYIYGPDASFDIYTGFDDLWALPEEPLPAGTECAIFAVYSAGAGGWPFFVGSDTQTALEVLSSALVRRIRVQSADMALPQNFNVVLDSDYHTAAAIYRTSETLLRLDGVEHVASGAGGSPEINSAFIYGGSPPENNARIMSLSVLLDPTEERIAAWSARIAAYYGLTV
jgi:hypothetical protein